MLEPGKLNLEKGGGVSVRKLAVCVRIEAVSVAIRKCKASNSVRENDMLSVCEGEIILGVK